MALVYLATYPRCGNSFLRGIISANWPYHATDIHDGDWGATCAYLTSIGYDVDTSEGPRPGFPPDLIWDDWIRAYTAGGKRYRIVKPGSKDWLSSEVRRRLAAEENVFFIKTHFLPYENWFPGEKVIQMVRDPISSIWSYKNLLDTLQRNKSPDILAISKGDVQFGSWSDYHRAWEQNHPPDFLRVSFEKTHADQAPTVAAIARFLRFPEGAVQTMSFAASQQRNPIRFRAGRTNDWERHLSRAIVQQIFSDHRQKAQELGYKDPLRLTARIRRAPSSVVNRIRLTFGFA